MASRNVSSFEHKVMEIQNSRSKMEIYHFYFNLYSYQLYNIYN